MSVLIDNNEFHGDIRVLSGSECLASFYDIDVKQISPNHFVIEIPNGTVFWYFNATTEITERKDEKTSNNEITVWKDCYFSRLLHKNNA